MEIFHSLDEIARRPGPSAVTIGSFDGIHLAHKELLRRVRQRAQREGWASVAVTFDPHPVAVLAPDKAPKMLTPLPVKLELLERSQIDRLLILPFTLEFSRWSPKQFVEGVLVQALRTKTVLVGENFRFGHLQAGNPEVLQQLGQRFGFSTEILEKMVLRRKVISSSQIRTLLQQGKITLANRLLGHPYIVRGPLEPGLGIGRTQTVPTFNVDIRTSLVPRSGVYITLARLGVVERESGPAAGLRKPLPAVSNVGYRPTFGRRALGVETHLLEFSSGQEPTILDVSFLYRLRDERKFESAEQLKDQIQRDIHRAQVYFRRLQNTGIPVTEFK